MGRKPAIPQNVKADRFRINDAVDVVMGQKEQFPGHRALSLYVLLVWARFPELHDTIDHYVAQSAMRLAGRYRLDKGELIDENNSGNNGFIETLQNATGLWKFLDRNNIEIASCSCALPGIELDRQRQTSDDVYGRRTVLAQYIVGGALHNNRLLMRSVAQKCFLVSAMGVNPKIWNKRIAKTQKTNINSGAVKGTFDGLWDKHDPGLLVRYLLGLGEMRSTDTIEENVVNDSNWETYSEDEKIEYLLQDNLALIEAVSASPKGWFGAKDLYSEFFERHNTGTIENIENIRVRLLAYAILVDKVKQSKEAKISNSQWTALQVSVPRELSGDGKIAKRAAEYLEKHRLTEKQITAVDVVVAEALKGKKS